MACDDEQDHRVYSAGSRENLRLPHLTQGTRAARGFENMKLNGPAKSKLQSRKILAVDEACMAIF